MAEPSPAARETEAVDSEAPEGERGSTFVELMIVLVILAVLIAVALYLARDEKVGHMTALEFSLLIAAMGLPVYGLAKINQRWFSRRRLSVTVESKGSSAEG